MEFWQVYPVFHSIFRHEKKVLALVLAFACAFTMFAGAASFTDEADIQAKDAVNMLTALGVIEGYEDGSFDPDGVVTRAEMAKMIFVVRNNTIDDSAYENITSNLTDINNHWAKGYIKFCESQGIIAGYGDGTFRADDPIDRAEVVTIVNRLLGREADEDYIADNHRRLVMFPDVSSRHWAYYNVLEAANAHTANLTNPETWDK